MAPLLEAGQKANTSICRADTYPRESFSLESLSHVAGVRKSDKLSSLPVLWHTQARYGRLFIRCLLRNDSGQPTKRQLTEERCRVARELLLERLVGGGRASWNIRVRFASQTEPVSLPLSVSSTFVMLVFRRRFTFDDIFRLADDIKSEKIISICARYNSGILCLYKSFFVDRIVLIL